MADFNKEVEKLVQTTVEQALAVSLVADGSVIVKEIVRQALEQKAAKYGSTTILQQALRMAIQAAAVNQVSVWVADHKAEIRAAVDEELRRRLTPQAIAEGVAASLSKVSFSVKLAQLVSAPT